METNPNTTQVLCGDLESPGHHENDLLEARLASFRTSRRCGVCNNLERRMLGYDKAIPQYRAASDFEVWELEKSSQVEACPFCALILAAIEQFEPVAVRSPSSTTLISRIYMRGPAETAPHTLSFEIYFKEARGKLELEIQAPSPTGVPAIDRVIRVSNGSFQPEHPLSELSLSWVRDRLTECLETHNKCSKTRDVPLPKRLLSLKAADSGSITVSLEETSGSQGSYACLSHRWGGSELVATKSQYTALLCGISWPSLPATFQDVICVSLALGIKYLWIDSLCIIQDDPDDWREEATMMASIYQNSYITFAATSSPGGARGCFWKSDSSYERTFDTAAGPLCVRKASKHWQRFWTSNVSEAVFPLLTRAWVFQERLLASRVVHFSDNELVWECNNAGACQCGGYIADSNPKMRNWTGAEAWTEAVELYTSLKLTREEDRLPALLGFARFYGNVTWQMFRSEYLAGLWRTSLHNDLMWRVSTLDSTIPLRFGSSLRLCRCFDTLPEDSSEYSVTCQYSYSSACSPYCLQMRRFCRYGLRDAAISRDWQIEGQCPGQTGQVTSIADLQELYKTDIHSLQDPPQPVPSWSWVSVSTAVKYWSNIRHVRSFSEVPRNFSSPCEIDDAVVIHSGNNIAGPITGAWLRLNGWIASPRLQYRYEPDVEFPRRRNHSIFLYALAFENVGAYKQLDFYPDYVLSFEGEKWMPEGTPLFLFHISRGIHLVLQRKSFFNLDRSGRLRLAIPLHAQDPQQRIYDLREDDTEAKFVRIGILRSPQTRGDVRYWPMRWLHGIVIE